MADNRFVTLPAELSEAELASVTDPARLLERAWALEPLRRYTERAATLDALEALLAVGGSLPGVAGREWRLELLAERAIDVGRSLQLDDALALVGQVVGSADESHQIALGRSMLAKGQALAWLGTDDATRRAKQAFAEAAELFAGLGHRDWQGSALLRCGYSACYQDGDLLGAKELIGEALEVFGPDSTRLAGALTPYADVLIDLGEFDAAEAVLERAIEVVERDELTPVVPEITWGQARVAAGRGEARATERLLREAERHMVSLDSFPTHIGLSFLLEAAENLDRVGLSDQACAYFERGRQRAGDTNEEVMQTRAVLRARSGDPGQAIDELQELARGAWLEKRNLWRHTLLTAWATFRAGRAGADRLAARAFEQAAACGGIRVAQAGEPDIVAALAPLAEQTGSAFARSLLLDGRKLAVRLFETPAVTREDGSVVQLPPGMPGALVRMLALHESGLPVDAVLETFFAEVPPESARDRLRQVLKRLRAAAGEIVLRDGETLRLIPAWVDVRNFLALANRVRAARGNRAVQLAYAALATCQGPLLPSDPYAAWAESTQEEVRYRHLELLDLIAADAAARGSHQEALTALQTSLKEDPTVDSRRAATAAHLRALDRHTAAEYLTPEPAPER